MNKLTVCVVSALMLATQLAIATEGSDTSDDTSTDTTDTSSDTTDTSSDTGDSSTDTDTAPTLDELWTVVDDNSTKLEEYQYKQRGNTDEIKANRNSIRTNHDNIVINNNAINDINGNVEVLKTYLEEQLELLNARLTAVEEGSSSTPAATPCFTFENTVEEDLFGNNWFDACVDAAGSTIRVVLKDGSGTTVYDAQGNIPTAWTYDQLTHATGDVDQVDYSGHNFIMLDNDDRLMISGKSSYDPTTSFSRCHNAYANGYGIVIVGPEEANVDSDGNPVDPSDPIPKIFVMPYKSEVGFSSPVKRAFISWSTSHEISYAPGGFHQCYFGENNGMVDDALIGSVEIYVE